ncbi:MAG TPA: hypothetical protein VGF67_30435 [Ktedonobacteraceae bacterium]
MIEENLPPDEQAVKSPLPGKRGEDRQTKKGSHSSYDRFWPEIAPRASPGKPQTLELAPYLPYLAGLLSENASGPSTLTRASAASHAL